MKKLITFNIVTTLLLIFILLFLKPGFRSDKDNFFNFFIILITVTNIFFFLFNIKNILNNWINFNTFFIIGFIIVHFQIIFLDSIGITPSDPSFIWINNSVVNYANWLSCMAISFYMLTSLVYYLRLTKNSTTHNKLSKPSIIKTKIIDYFLLITFSTFLVLVGSSFLEGKYDGGESWGAGASYLLIAVKAVLVIRIIYLFYNFRLVHNSISFFKFLLKNKIVVIILALFLAMFINSGDRGPIIEFGLLIIFLYSLYVKRINGFTLFFIVIVGSIFMTVLREGRGIKDSDDNIFDRGINNLGDRNSSGFTEELASSVRILFRAIDVVPTSQDYLLGTTMITDISSSVPFLSGIIIENFNIPMEYRSSTRFFTIQGQGINYSYGEGSEIIGDIYINFGPLFVLFFFSVLGYFIAKISPTRYQSYSFAQIIVVVVYFSSSIYLNRSVFFYPLQLITYTLLFDYIFRKKLS